MPLTPNEIDRLKHLGLRIMDEGEPGSDWRRTAMRRLVRRFSSLTKHDVAVVGALLNVPDAAVELWLERAANPLHP